MAERPLFVLDDDPTGAQMVADVPVLLRWTGTAIDDALSNSSVAHLITNSRALDPDAARRVTADAAGSAWRADPRAQIVLRGDSTLRGHVFEEYQATRSVGQYSRAPVLLLVPALPSAGRVTVGGVHYLERDGVRIRLDETEYARDGAFAYSTSRLLDWADERSSGFFAAARGIEVPAEAMRARGPDAVKKGLLAAWSADGPAVCAPDAETLEDLGTIAEGLREAQQAEVEVSVRCAPAFAAVLSGTLAQGFVSVPPVSGGVLVICGSYVSGSRRQLGHLSASHDVTPVELSAQGVLGSVDTMTETVDEALEGVRAQLREGSLAVLATESERRPDHSSLQAGMQIARAQAAVVAGVRSEIGALISKGGITSAVVVEFGLGATAARVVGPLLPGVSMWEVDVDGRRLNCAVVPGNVGTDALLTDLVDLFTEAERAGAVL